MVRSRVLLDCDGVLADFHTPCLRIINMLTGSQHKTTDIDQWSIFDALSVPLDVKRATYDVMNSSGWCSNLEVYHGAYEGFAELSEIADVYVVTSPMRGDTWHREREKWLEKHFRVPTSRIIHGSAKYVCHGAALIDDHQDNLERWKREPINRGGLAVKWRTYPSQACDYTGPKFDSWSSMNSYLREQLAGGLK